MTPTDWLLALIAAMVVLVFFERLAFIVFATVFLLIKLVDFIIGGVIGRRRT